MNLRNGFFVFLVCLLMAGCVTGPQQRAFDKTANARLESVEILPMRQSDVGLFIFNNPGYSFGLIGITIAEANRAPKVRWLKGEVEKAKFDHVDTFFSALDSAMSDAGYTLVADQPRVETEDAQAKRDALGFRRAYGTSNRDGQLDVNFGFIGYAAAGSSDKAPYRPTVVLNARLMDSSGKHVLFEDQIVYNAVMPGAGEAITLNPDERYRYPDFDQIKAAGPEVVDGLKVAFTSVAQELARQLQH
jgi:hypothetical protein